MIDPLFNIVVSLFLSGLLLASARHKLVDRTAFIQAVSAYHLLPNRLVAAASVFLALGELLIGVALLLPFAQPWAGWAAALIFSTYAVAMSINLSRGLIDIDCGCSLGRSGFRLSWLHPARNAILICLALLTLVPMTGRPLIWFDLVQTAAAVIVLGFLYLAAEALLSNRALMEKNA
ncbi:MauE/DoxX family redox-associated membrane protein [Sphingosinicella microcystinivorans]|uniref:MauE/DoxX family redox-associated membrane protein n=1 Tax=Sphingosinicella microcystinivorans TaxID=335406 RepID=UPI0022F3D9A3|nr:MauE/DoxX family redox-associated membrane protein [Sphingosinicella microcystinivorans]WBX84618.1 hypothetical protein PE061_01450 [Sphingosinicella microcystinivorans]